MRALAAVLLAFAGACRVSSPAGPGPSSLAVEVSSGAELVPAAPLRLAVVFGSASAMVPVSDVPAAIGDTVELPLDVPPGPWEDGVAPLEQAYLPTLATLDVYRPRVVLYEDVDGSGDFLPLSAGGPDVVAAIDTSTAGPSVAAVLHLDEALSRMTLEETEAYYAASGGRYTPFVRVQGPRGSLQLAAAATAGPLHLTPTDSPIPAEHLVCGRDPVYVYGDPLAPATHVTAHLDEGVDPVAFCGSTLPACSVAPLADAPPDLSEQDTEGRRRVVQCRRSDTLEVVVVQLAVLVCESCLCRHDTSADVYVAAVGATPGWWPCGTTVTPCDSTMPLYQLDATCVPPPPAPGP